AQRRWLRARRSVRDWRRTRHRRSHFPLGPRVSPVHPSRPNRTREPAMPFELHILAWGCILGLVHILAAGQAKTRQYGVAWNTGPRDADVPPPGPVAGRLIRAQGNFFETFPIAAAALLLAGLLPLGSGTTALGAALWLGA